ncbi:metallophosphoesterase [Pseudomonas sp. GZD-222]|uniref:metallophosphoesterase n=1 Tax=Pseudomonas sp. GZD-222 TaxID=3404805 RepID=UPI003BB62FBF
MIWFLGDAHGRFDHVIRLVKLHRPEPVVFLGDLECSLPLNMILRPILELTEVWYIHGNHGSDRPARGNSSVKKRFDAACKVLNESQREASEHGRGLLEWRNTKRHLHHAVAHWKDQMQLKLGLDNPN